MTQTEKPGHGTHTEVVVGQEALEFSSAFPSLAEMLAFYQTHPRTYRQPSPFAADCDRERVEDADEILNTLRAGDIYFCHDQDGHPMPATDNLYHTGFRNVAAIVLDWCNRERSHFDQYASSLEGLVLAHHVRNAVAAYQEKHGLAFTPEKPATVSISTLQDAQAAYQQLWQIIDVEKTRQNLELFMQRQISGLTDIIMHAALSEGPSKWPWVAPEFPSDLDFVVQQCRTISPELLATYQKIKQLFDQVKTVSTVDGRQHSAAYKELAEIIPAFLQKLFIGTVAVPDQH
jgi:hypothetical protein